MDSLNFDGKGNGSQVSWTSDGNLESAGLWKEDTLKVGKWKYYHNNGQLQAQAVYDNGKMISLNCFDKEGNPLNYSGELDGNLVASGNKGAYFNKLTRGLQNSIERIAKKYPKIDGMFMVQIELIVNADGSLTGFTPLTSYGYDLEEEAIRILKTTAPWTPATRCGQPYRAKVIQPITFVLTTQ